ncbi:DE-cadherin [Schistocerca serialis cubense]|uniref:DE-cadherin n=1 Tax=Schistocerca serialis cubense TaxID=2023355 RepID=UPI00214F185E|nr:DE-cadherin [Schistocerca serialis cubense]
MRRGQISQVFLLLCVCCWLVFGEDSLQVPGVEQRRARQSGAKLRHSRHLAEKSATHHAVPRADPSDAVPLIVHDNHKPMFTNCSNYQPSVKEEQDIGTYVAQVKAEDRDPLESGGTITYSIVTTKNDREKFSIDSATGIIRTSQQFDRDEPRREKEVYLTVRATDNGLPQLDDVCTIKVTIEDINDNKPMFDKVHYQESAPQDLKLGQEVMRVSALDIDDGNNSIVSYDLEPAPKQPTDRKYFRIDRSSGVILLDSPINDKDIGYTFRLVAKATDHGVPPLSATVDLEIVVVETNKKSPTIEPDPFDNVYQIPENYSDFSAPIITIKAQSNIPNSPELQFLLVSGQTQQSNSVPTFRLETDAKKDKAYIKLAGKELDYETITEYHLTVRVENKYQLAHQQRYTIKILDVNDNVPIFRKIESGYVSENEPPGTPVLQVKAIDADGTEAHNQVTYALADDNTDLFSIDPKTGNITTKKSFDRETNTVFLVKVLAYDNSPSALLLNGKPNKGEQQFQIWIADKNDNQPVFEHKLYTAHIEEDANINSMVTQVKAIDNDTASIVMYSIINNTAIGEKDDNPFTIEPRTGKIRVSSQLDYERTTKYTLLVRAFDGVYEDYTTVNVLIDNVNDNPPVFEKYEKEIEIYEERIPDEKCLVTLKAYDPDIADRSAPQNIVYFVFKDEQKKLLDIDKDGCLMLLKPLDRDPPNGYEAWQVLIAADDEGGGPTSQSSITEVIINLIDINDNAPFLSMAKPVIWEENKEPGNITALNATDYDGPKNGPPFTFRMSVEADRDTTEKFEIRGNSLFALKVFDREEKKKYLVPITITDSGEPQQTGTSTLTVIIGDVNDNAMQEGRSSIFVYNYKGEAPNTEIGQVYVEDPDDWDLPDKHFRWKGESHPNFNLDAGTGMITMLAGTQGGEYLLEFTVREEGIFVKEHEVNAYVNVTVKEIPEEAVDKSGSIRFYGVTAEEFVAPGPNGKPSMKNLLQLKLSKFLNVSLENVDVFTVLHSPHNDSTDVLDVRFSAHGSPYYQPERLNAIVAEHQDEIERDLGVKMLMINIDECLLEKVYCESSCRNFLNKTNKPYAVYTNTSSFVGVRAVVDPICSCAVLPERIVCLNGGTAVGERCECLEGFEGPQCEIISVGFYGNGYALYPSLDACEQGHISLELTPHLDDGLIFYVGPVTPTSGHNVRDFMALYLHNGFLRLLMDYGSGTVSVEQNQKLTDGKPHFIDILWSKTTIELDVDHCQMSSCVSFKAPVPPNEYLNVNGPLQLGGTFTDLTVIGARLNWTNLPVMEGFGGCIRNLTFNGKTYNLGMPGDAKNVDPGCNRGLAKAVSFGINTNFLVAILICIAIFLILILAVVVQRRKSDDMYKDTDDIRENIINYEDEGGGEGDMTGYDLNVLRFMYDGQGPNDKAPVKENLKKRAPDEVPDICGFLDGKKKVCDNDPESTPFDDVRHYAYEGDGNSSGSLSSLASGTDDGDLDFDYLSSFGPRFRKLADMYGEEPSDEEDDTFHNPASESWC